MRKTSEVRLVDQARWRLPDFKNFFFKDFFNYLEVIAV